MATTYVQLEFDFNPLVRQPLHKWFSAESDQADAWFGPFNTIEEAALACMEEMLPAWTGEFIGCFIAQGKRLKKSEQSNVEYDYEVKADSAFRVSVRRLAIVPRPEKPVEVSRPERNVPVAA